MIGQTVSHYRIVDLLGAGGMGVVYKAEDSRLRRFVALKFLPPELTLDREAKERFVHEAQAASALDHPNICTIHEIDQTDEGRLFIAMAYYPGETLKHRLARGPLPAYEAVSIAAQIALAVAAAHNAGIIHRDIKPANVMLTESGEVKLLDFGLAKLPQSAIPTRSTAAVGTIAYMAPEQVSGITDARTDVWSLGVVLYEMLAGELPFRGDNDGAVLNAILHETPQPLADRRHDIGEALPALVHRALQKDPASRYGSANDFLDELSRVQDVRTPIPRAVPAAPPRQRALLRTTVMLSLTAIVIALAGAIGWSVYRARTVRRVSETALPQIRQLIAQDNYVKALIVADEAERVLGNDSDLAALVHDAINVRPIRTNPPGAFVWIRDPALRSEWMLLGTTPIESARIPPTILRWKFEHTGYDAVEFIRTGLPSNARLQTAPNVPDRLDLTPGGSIPDRMVRVPAGSMGVPLTGFDPSISIPAGEYLIDKYEVTNREFKEFVDAGGYQKRQFWTRPFVVDGHVIDRDEALARFHDQTGRPGPSTWEVGTYAKGEEDYPVAGVSWYEAAAYAEFKGRSLPTVYHWLRAAGTSASAHITPISNFTGKVGRSGQYAGVSPYGLFDVAGNVKEWCFNELEPGRTRYILGGAATDPEYMFFFADARSPFDRSPFNGFRTAKYPAADSLPDVMTVPVINRPRDYDRITPVSDEVFRAYMGLYAYDPAPLSPKVELVDDSSPVWRRERVTFAATYGKDHVIAHVFLPRTGAPPYQTVVFWPGSGVIQIHSSEPPLQLGVIDWLVLSGRAVVYPIYYGTYERHTDRDSGWPAMTRAYSEWVMKQVQDARRTLDYIESRPDLRHDRIGFLGFSWGGVMGNLVLALDHRFQAAIFLSAGFSSSPAPPEVDALNFAPRVSAPVLMINGSQDYVVGVDTGQRPMFRSLGTPPDRKRHVVLAAGHAVIFDKRSDVIREGLDWFDRYLGTVK